MNQKYIEQSFLEIKVKDDSFDVDLLSQFDLCLQIDENKFNFCVVDSITSRCLLLESYNLVNYPDISVFDQLYNIFEEHHVLMAGYWKSVKICTNNKQYSLVPNHLFDENSMDKYLTCHTTDPYSRSLYRYKHKSPESVNVFAVNSELVEWFKKFYPPNIVSIVHQTSTLIEGVMKDRQSISVKTIYLSVQKKNFTIAVKDENSLQYCNTFSYSSPEELIFYLIFVTTSLGINKKSTKIILFGEIDKNSTVYSKITTYFKVVSFGVKPSYLRYGYVFDEIPDHYFFDLFSIYLC